MNNILAALVASKGMALHENSMFYAFLLSLFHSFNILENVLSNDSLIHFLFECGIKHAFHYLFILEK